MRKQRSMKRRAGWTILIAALAAFGFSGSASAKLTEEYEKFTYCPRTETGVNKCLYSINTGGEVVLGSKTVPIVNPVILQGGFSKPVENISKFYGATNGDTLSKTPQPVPGGLLGLVPPESSPPIVKALVKAAAENGLTGVNATLELARPATEILFSEIHLASEEGLALKLPVKVHLENPVLGSSCYVGSSTTPIYWELTTGITNPPEPNKPIQGVGGGIDFLDEGRIAYLFESKLVDNAWSAPGASGCGGLLSALIDPIIDSQSGLPAAAGTNTAILEVEGYLATVVAVNKNDAEHP